MKRYVASLLLLLLLSGCERQVRIDDHFSLSSFDTDDLSLIYLDSGNYMFSVINSDVVAYLKCGNHIYVIQHPVDSMGVPDANSPQFFVLDTSIDYSDERRKPYSISKSRFEEMLKSECGNKELVDL